MARPKKRPKPARLTENIKARVARTDVARVNALAERLGLKEAAVVRVALRIGMARLEEDPSRMLEARETPRDPAT